MRTIIRDNYTPTPGDYHEVIVRDEVNDKQWIFDCDGVVTDITDKSGVVVVNELGPSTTAATSQALVTEELGKKQDSLSEEQMAVLDSGIDAEKVAQIATNTANITAETSARTSADTAIRNDLTALTGRVTTAEGDINTIEDKIPAQATAQNQLADKNFVNSSIATNTANFIGTFNSVAELEAYTGAVTNNDYAFVIVTDTQGNTAYNRYKYNGDTSQWIFEYELNNSSFTAEQWAAINSGITSGNVDKLTGLANIKSIGANLSLSQAGELSATNTTYTAGTGLNLNGTQFSVDTTTIATQSDLTAGLATKQNTLTAGTNIQINNNTISATDTTYTDFTGTDGTTAGTAGLVPAPATTDAGKVLGSDGNWVTGGPAVVQTTGTSTTDVMSQNATTSMVYADPSTKGQVCIGANSTSSGGVSNGGSVAIGRYANALGTRSICITTGENSSNQGWARAIDSIAIGSGAITGESGNQFVGLSTIALGCRTEARQNNAVALGSGAKTTQAGEFNIGTANAVHSGYNSSNYRLLTGLYDPQSDHDAATKGYVDSVAPTITMTTTDPGEGVALAANNFIAVYQ